MLNQSCVLRWVTFSHSVWSNFELSVEADVGSVPIATASQCQDVVCLDCCHDIVIALKPVIATGVHPANVMTAVSRASLVRHDTNKLIVSRVQSRVEGPVQQLVVLLNLLKDASCLSCRTNKSLLLPLFLGLFFVLHLDVSVLGLFLLAFEDLGVFLSTVLSLKGTSLEE